jgi:hypothetical protein
VTISQRVLQFDFECLPEYDDSQWCTSPHQKATSSSITPPTAAVLGDDPRLPAVPRVLVQYGQTSTTFHLPSLSAAAVLLNLTANRFSSKKSKPSSPPTASGTRLQVRGRSSTASWYAPTPLDAPSPTHVHACIPISTRDAYTPSAIQSHRRRPVSPRPEVVLWGVPPPGLSTPRVVCLPAEHGPPCLG